MLTEAQAKEVVEKILEIIRSPLSSPNDCLAAARLLADLAWPTYTVNRTDDGVPF